MAGRPPKPTALKLLQGNPGKRPIPKREPKPKVGAKAPVWLDAKEKKSWGQIAPKLEELRVLTEVDDVALGMLCRLLAESTRQKAEGKVHASLASEIRAYLGRFGMTPSDRVKAQVLPEGEPDPFDVFLHGKKG